VAELRRVAELSGIPPRDSLRVGGGGGYQAGRIEESEPVTPDTCDQLAGFQHPEDPPGHLAAGPDQDRQVGASQHRRRPEEEICVLVKHPRDPSQGVLVEESIEPAHHLVEGPEDVVQDVDSEAGIDLGSRAHLVSLPYRGLTRRQGDRIGRGGSSRQGKDRRQLSPGHDPDHVLATVDRRAADGDVPLEEERKTRRVALRDDDLAGIDAAHCGHRRQVTPRVGPAVWKRLANDVQEASRRRRDGVRGWVGSQQIRWSGPVEGEVLYGAVYHETERSLCNKQLRW